MTQFMNVNINRLWKLLLVAASGALGFQVSAKENCLCENWRIEHPDWIWCDDFDGSAPIAERYFDDIVISTSRIGCDCENLDEVLIQQDVRNGDGS
jgi:hypothetical protein